VNFQNLFFLLAYSIFLGVSINQAELKIISTIKPNYYIKGQDYKNLQKKDKNLINEIKAVKRAKGIIKIIDERGK
jgi:bifunctional ADP-heptose synthase (sugar kinase/adenylyltransferase)